jgi:hypothetical protein
MIAIFWIPIRGLCRERPLRRVHVRSRAKTALSGQVGAHGKVTLTDAQFFISGYCGPMNTFDAFVHGKTLSLEDWSGDCGIIEQLAQGRYLKLSGSAEATIGTDSIRGAFDGSVSIGVVPDDPNPIATCTSHGHQLMFERTGPTAVGSHGR